MFENQVVGEKTYMVLQFIQGVQILYFTFMDTFAFTWNEDPLFSAFRTIVKYFQVDVHLRAGGTNLIMTLNITLFFINFLFLLLLGFMIRRMKKKTPLIGVEIVIVQFISVYLSILSTVLVIPTVQIYLLSAYCNQDPIFNTGATCYTGLYMGNTILGALSMLVQLCLICFFVYYYNDFNPLSNSPYAASNTFITLMTTLRLLLYPLYVSFDFGNNLTRQFTVAQLGIQLFLLYLRISMETYYSHKVEEFWVAIEGYILIFSLGAVIQAFLDTDGEKDLTGFIFCFLLAPIASVASVFVGRMRLEKKLKVDLDILKKSEEWLDYLVQVIPLIAHKRVEGQDVLLEGLLRSLKENPKYCELVSDELILQGEFDEERKATRAALWAVFMKELLKVCLKKEKKSAELHLISGYIFYEKLGNKYRALYEVSKAMSYNPSFNAQFTIYRLTKTIEFDLMNEDEKLTEDRGINYHALVVFSDGYAVFQRLLVRACRYHKKLFEEIDEKTPDIFRIHKYGNKLMKQKDIISNHFTALCKINPNHTRSLKLYSRFLETVLNDGEGAYNLHEKSLQIASRQIDAFKSSSDVAKDKYEVNSLTAIIVTSGDMNKLGIVLSANTLVEQLYGFTEKDLVGHNINKLIPEFYKTKHEEYFKDFFEREDDSRPMLGTVRTVYAKNNKDYIVPSTILIKAVPEITGVFKLVGFLSPVDLPGKSSDNSEKVAGMLILPEQRGTLHGITENCTRFYGISKSLVFNKKNEDFRVADVVRDIFENNNLEKAKHEGVELYLQVGVLQQQTGSDQDDDTLDLDELAGDIENRLYDDDDNPLKNKDVILCRFKATAADAKTPLLYITFVPTDMAAINDEDYVPEGEEDELKELVKEREEDDAKYGIGRGRQDQNEDRRRLQEFFTNIKETVFPSRIKTVVYLYIFSVLSILGVAIAAFYYNYKLKDTNVEALKVLRLSQQRGYLVPQIIFSAQSINMVANGFYSDNSTQAASVETSAKSMIAYLVNQLQKVNVDAVNYQIAMDSALGNSTKAKQYTVSLMLSNNEIKTFTKDFNDALLQFVTSASLIQNETIAGWKTDLINSPQRDYFYVEENGLKVLRVDFLLTHLGGEHGGQRGLLLLLHGQGGRIHSVAVCAAVPDHPDPHLDHPHHDLDSHAAVVSVQGSHSVLWPNDFRRGRCHARTDRRVH